MASNWFDDNGYVSSEDGVSQTQPIGTPEMLAGATPQAPTAPPVTAPPYRTGGYNAPAAITARSGAAPAGWDQAKWDNANHQSPKYAVAGIVQNALAKGEKNLTPDTVAEIAKAYPGTQQVNGTTVNIPGLGEVQVMNDGQARWDPAGSFGPSGGSSGGGGGFSGDSTSSAGGMMLGNLGTSLGLNAPQTNLTSGGFNYAQAVPQTERVNYTPFVLPTREEALATDPGFQFGLDQGLGQLGAQASARGSIHDPNYLQGMTKFAIDYGNQHYSEAANRLFQTHQANQGGAATAVNANNATALGAQGQGFGQSLSGFNANLGALGQQQQYGLGLGNLALGQGNLALGNKQADNSYALGQGNLNLNRDQFGLATQGQYWNQAFNNNAQTWDQYYKLAQLGYPQS